MHSTAFAKRTFWYGTSWKISFKHFFLKTAIIAGCLYAPLTSNSQNINLTVKSTGLEKVFRMIEKQSAYRFVFAGETLETAIPVSINVRNASINNVLSLCFDNQPLTYSINEQVIMVKARNFKKEFADTNHLISGRIINDQGETLEGATVAIKGKNQATATDGLGNFSLKSSSALVTLVITNVGYNMQEIVYRGKSPLIIKLAPAINTLDETVVIAYGKTTRRINTGNVSTVTSEEIGRQPVSNPLAALTGRVPGLLITESNGYPGSSIKIQLRGQSSIGLTPGILPANDPLFVINGVPYAPNNNQLNQINSALGNGGLSPLNNINPSDIESIEILKDADATAIYGSRGANGVVLITTKKGKAGKTSVNVNVYTGIQKALQSMDLLQTAEYVAMRKEAIANDGLIASRSNAPDLVLWDTTRYTNWKKQFIGGTAYTTNAQLSLSGGNESTQFMIGSAYYHQTTVIPGDFAFNRGSFNLNLNHSTSDHRFKIDLTTLYSVSQNNIPSQDFTGNIRLAPNAPSLYDSTGNLRWQENGARFLNPLSYLRRQYSVNIDNLLTNLLVSYRVLPGLTFRSSFGYNIVHTKETSTIPIASQDPFYNGTGRSQFGNGILKSWIIEPQLEYIRQINNGKITVLTGATWQDNNSEQSAISATGYTDDALIKSPEAAPIVSFSTNHTLYRYEAVFARFNYNLNDKYIINFSGRRDGSSRFGPARRFSNFGAVGAAWVFSGEKFIKDRRSFISFGKVRGSYGTTGNDQIGDYQYLDLWRAITGITQYQGIPAFTPTHLLNADFQWELNKKLEGAIDLGFLKDKILLSLAYFRNRSSNQLIAYPLPTQTGFSSLNAKNFPALVQNSGVELSFTSKNISTTHLTWNTMLNLTVPRNKLISFPDLNSSSYASSLQEGKSLSVQSVYHFAGVDPATGIFKLEDIDKDGSITPKDLIFYKDLDPKVYGGIGNTLAYRGLELYLFIEGRKQTGINYLKNIYSSRVPGFIGNDMFSNQPIAVLDRWQKPGDVTNIQKFTASPGSPAYEAIANFITSDNTFTDASYIRVKTVSISWQLPALVLKRLKVSMLRLYLQSQNLLTITNMKGSDPETQNVFSLPPLRTLTAGIQCTF